MRKVAWLFVITSLMLLAPWTDAQDVPPSFVVHPNQQVMLDRLHLRIAANGEPIAAITAALETAFDNADVCCGRKSTFSEMSDLAGHPSLRDIGTKLNGQHVLGDGQPVVITADYRPGSVITSFELVNLLMRQEHMLVQWNGQVYVVSGIVFDDKVFDNGNHDYVLKKILMLDPSLKNGSHKIVFNRDKDDWSKIEGFLVLKVSM